MRHPAPGTGIVWILVALAAAATIFASRIWSVVAAEDALLLQARNVFKKLPNNFADQDHPITPMRVALGRALFFDPRWSVDQNVSCATCHNPALYGTDALPKSIGVKGKQHPRNAQTVLNAAGDIAANWRGERKNVEEQAIVAAIAPFSTGHTDHAGWSRQIEAIAGYRAMFQRAFPDESTPMTPGNLSLAIGAYERTLVTPAPFDSYLDGNVSALTPQARAGLRTFMTVGCAACHNGAGVGGSMYQKFGLHLDYWKATGSAVIDRGRIDITKNDADLYVFKVPGLRNVTMTGPYFHDGSVASLREAVKIMGRVQLGRTLSDEEVTNVVAFLNSLTGKLPQDFATLPELPPSAPQ